MIMCGCELCIVTLEAQKSLNQFRKDLPKQMKKDMKELEHKINEMKQLRHSSRSQATVMDTMKRKLQDLNDEYQDYVDFCYINDEPIHSKAEDAVKTMYYRTVMINDVEHFPFKCVLSRCNDCQPFKYHKLESNEAKHSKSVLIRYE